MCAHYGNLVATVLLQCAYGAEHREEDRDDDSEEEKEDGHPKNGGENLGLKLDAG
jgi:hypothetical protein